MRTLIGVLLTLTTLSPLPVAAQVDRDAGVQPQAEDRVDIGPRPDRAATQAPRADARFERAERAERFNGGERAGRPDRGIDRPAREDRPRFDRGTADQQPGRSSNDRYARRDRFDDGRADGARADGGDPPRSYGDVRRDTPVRGDRDRSAVYRDGGDFGDRTRGTRNDWTRSRLATRDDRWTQSRFDDRSAWNRGWRSDRRYDRSDHRGAYRLPRYYAPGGWGGGYRRFGVGISLQRAFWAQDYWIADPYSYRLPEAYGPYRWVRYYGDALLVDLRSGLVVDAVYDIFG